LGHGSALWLMNSDGSGATLLLDEPQHIVARPRWSPDGERWAYILMPDSAAPFPVGELWVMDSAGARRLSDQADAGRGVPPVWLSGGRIIAFVAREASGEQERRVYLADVASGYTWPITMKGEK
jgi:Tol biopolymer transport system component